MASELDPVACKALEKAISDEPDWRNKYPEVTPQASRLNLKPLFTHTLSPTPASVLFMCASVLIRFLSISISLCFCTY